MIIIDEPTKETIQENFGKRDLLDVVGELGIANVEITTRYSEIVSTIVKDCNDNGVPEWGDCSKMLRKFLITAKITDKNGELIEASTGEAGEEAEVGDIEYPDCYGLADERDPACGRCKVMKTCMEKHKEALPPCFGKDYSANAPECEVCIEKTKCEEQTG